ncbi:hypothetical protein [Lichenicoccus sp.]|uniref:hypothetical protein n=1 Tax=Lichenicoccus sp. TaxID=2781899 RepID=UPI003D0B8499
MSAAHHQREAAIYWKGHCGSGAISERIGFDSIDLPDELDPTRWRDHALLDTDVYQAINDFGAATANLGGFYLRKANEELEFDPHPLLFFRVEGEASDPVGAQGRLEQRTDELRRLLDAADQLSDLLQRYRGTLRLPRRIGWEARARALSGTPPPTPPNWMSRKASSAKAWLRRRV